MKKIFLLLLLLGINTFSLSSSESKKYSYVDKNTTIDELLNNEAFRGFEKFLLPLNRYSDKNLKLNNISSLLPYHNNIDTGTTVNSLNYLVDERNNGRKIFYDFYTKEDSKRKDTGLFFFRGNPGSPFAVICPGGGFSYVGSIHEGFPYAVELSRKGYNAFVIQYRTGNGYDAIEDLAAALSFIFDNAENLQVSKSGYSLWGSSAGARMAAAIGSYGTAAFGGKTLPKPAAVIMAYTGQSSFTENDPPTFAVVGSRDGIANPNIVEKRIDNLKKAGIDTEFHRYNNVGHGFGTGRGTAAEGWINKAVLFWEKHIF